MSLTARGTAACGIRFKMADGAFETFMETHMQVSERVAREAKIANPGETTRKAAKTRVGVRAVAIVLAVGACGRAAETAGREDGSVVTEAYDGVPGNPDLLRLTSVDEPAVTLADASVHDNQGDRIGAVRSVDLSSDGGLDALIIGLDDGRRLRAGPLQARYDAQQEVVVVSVDLDHLEPAEG